MHKTHTRQPQPSSTHPRLGRPIFLSLKHGLERSLNLIFKNKEGRVVIAQWPNKPLLIWLSLKLTKKISPTFHPELLSLAASIILIYWAFLEIHKGDALFRRLLGLIIATATLLSLIN